jgi:hypothetical protein
MEQGFWHPENGYWQTLTPPSADTLAGYPEGTVMVPLRPSPGHEWSGEAWVAPPAAPAPVPPVVSRFQARAAMMLTPHGEGTLLEAVTAAVAAADPMVQLAWAEAVEWQRASPAINGLGAGLGLTAEDLDDLFRLAATIQA